MKHTILIVEDDPLNRKLLSELLALKGYRILEAHDGKEGVAQAIAQVPELILMDIHMPVMGGVDAVQQIRKEEAVAGGHTPIIALTADALKGTQERLLSEGFDGYLTKPFRLAEIAATLQKVTETAEV